MPNSIKSNSHDVPVTSPAEVRHLLGPLNDDAVTQILRVGPSFGELEIAALFAQGEGDRVDRMGHKLTGRAAQVYEILSREEADAEDLTPRA
jgi:hypothetical protein